MLCWQSTVYPSIIFCIATRDYVHAVRREMCGTHLSFARLSNATATLGKTVQETTA